MWCVIECLQLAIGFIYIKVATQSIPKCLCHNETDLLSSPEIILEENTENKNGGRMPTHEVRLYSSCTTRPMKKRLAIVESIDSLNDGVTTNKYIGNVRIRADRFQ